MEFLNSLKGSPERNSFTSATQEQNRSLWPDSTLATTFSMVASDRESMKDSSTDEDCRTESSQVSTPESEIAGRVRNLEFMRLVHSISTI